MSERAVLDIPAALAVCNEAAKLPWFLLTMPKLLDEYDAAFCIAARAGWPLALERLREAATLLRDPAGWGCSHPDPQGQRGHPTDCGDCLPCRAKALLASIQLER